MKVEELERYGKTLTTIPKKVMKKQLGIMIREIRKKFRVLGIVPFFIKVLLEQRKLKLHYPQAYREALKISKDAAEEVTMLIAIFNVIAQKESRENAYEFVKVIFQKVAVHSMPAFYQIEELVQCEGDPFENFMKFNTAWFRAMQEAGTYDIDTNKIENDVQTIVVSRCANVVLGKAFNCLEIAKLGCDHDLAGYPVILDRVNA